MANHSEQHFTRAEAGKTFTICRISGAILCETPKALEVFPQFQVRAATHWIFSQDWLGLERVTQSLAGKRPTIQQRQLLMLAKLLHPSTFGKLLDISRPIIFSAKDVIKYYGLVDLITAKMHALSDQDRRIALADLPRFSTEAFSRAKAAEHAGVWREDAEKLGAGLINWLKLVNEHVATCGLAYAYQLGAYTTEEIDGLAARFARDLGGADLPASRNTVTTDLNEYWVFLLDEIATEFDLGKSWKREAAAQLINPNSAHFLTELLAYLRGMANTSAARGGVFQIPARVYSLAIQAIGEAIAGLALSERTALDDFVSFANFELVEPEAAKEESASQSASNPALAAIKEKLAAKAAARWDKLAETKAKLAKWEASKLAGN